MDRAISLAALIPAMIAVTPVTAQAVESAPAPAQTSASTAAVVDAALDESDASKPRTVRIAGKTVNVGSLPADEDAKPAPTPPAKDKRTRR